MTTPIELINERLKDITLNLKTACNNKCDSLELEKLTEYYNLYFTAFQLLQHHDEIHYKFSRLIYNDKKKLYTYGYKQLNYHIDGIKAYEKITR